MERREFLKYFLALSTSIYCGCQSNKNQGNIKITHNNEDLKTIDHIGIPICYHCNLNCAYCNHFAPLANKYEMPVEVFEKDIKQLNKITNGQVLDIALNGGEPLLHPEINKFLDILNYYFPDISKTLLTNGILLKDMPKTFWESCKKNGIRIICTLYPIEKEYPDIRKTIIKYEKKYGPKIISYNSSVTCEKFVLTNLNNTKNNNIDNQNCELKIGHPQLDNGLIYPCCVMSNIKIFNNYFKEYKIPITDNDYINIYKIDSVEEINAFLNKPYGLCKYCDYGKQEHLWKLSEKKLEEWYNI